MCFLLVFFGRDDVGDAEKYARDIHAHVWSKDGGDGAGLFRSTLAVRAEAHEQMKGRYARQREKRARDS